MKLIKWVIIIGVIYYVYKNYFETKTAVKGLTSLQEKTKQIMLD